MCALLADEDDLRDVRSAVADLSGRWQYLVVSLEIPLGDLEAILYASTQNYKVWTSLIPRPCLVSTDSTVCVGD